VTDRTRRQERYRNRDAAEANRLAVQERR